MSYNGSGQFLINSTGQPVVANTVISATVFNALTADLATGLSTAITKDGQTTITANIPFGNNKITGLAAGTAATDSANLGQVQSTAAKLITVTGTDTITGSMSPALTAYAAGQLFYFVAAGANTGAVTINIDGLGAKSITRDGATALANGDINSGEVVVLVYDGTRFQMINAANSFGNTTINGTLTVTGNTGLQANVSITSALSVGGTFNVTGAAALGSTLSVTGKSDLPTVSTASMNAAVALITTGTVTNLTATGASIASANIGNLQFTAASIASINAGVAVVTNLTATSASIASANVGTAVITTGTVTNLTSTSASIASANAAVALVTTGTVTNLTSTSASIASANLGTAVVTGLTVTGASIASVNVGAAVLSGNLTLNGGTASGVLYLDGSKVATSGSALVFDGTNLGIGATSPTNALTVGTTSAGKNIAIYSSSNGNNGLLRLYDLGGTERLQLSANSTGEAVYYAPTGSVHAWYVNTEQMRLTSTGLGIGTTSPGYKLDVACASGAVIAARLKGGDASSNNTQLRFAGANANVDQFAIGTSISGGATGRQFEIYDLVSNVSRLFIDSSGNLGLGVTPSAWTDYKALQTTGAAFMGFSDGASNNQAIIAANAFFTTASTWKYVNTDNASYYQQYDGQHIWYNAPSGTAGNAITFTQAMTLDASGNLLVGFTGVPSGWNATKLTIRALTSADQDGFSCFASGNLNNINVSHNGTVGIISTDYGTGGSYTPITFKTSGTERARITAGGYFKASDAGTYLGSTAAYHELRNTANTPALIASNTNASFADHALQVDVTRDTTNNSFYAISYYNRGAAAYKFRVADSGDVTNTNNSYGAISDEKMKQDIVDASSQWDDIKGLRVRKFRYKSDPTAPLQIGLVAQETETVSPGLVDEHADRDAEGNDLGTTTKSVKYSILYMKAIKALQEAMARIEKLEAEVAAMKGVA